MTKRFMTLRAAMVGAVLALAPSAGVAAPAFGVVYSFSGGADGGAPQARLLVLHGNLLGTTTAGGSANMGTVFEVTPDGTETVLHSFTGGAADGQTPRSGLVEGGDGWLYGTTYAGGKSGGGTLFKLRPRKLEEVVLYNFAGGGDGSSPWGSVVLTGNGQIYGTTQGNGAGTLFRFSEGEIADSVVHGFGSLAVDGAGPVGQILLDLQGNFYGTTSGGGDAGTIYKIAANGAVSLLHSFTGYSQTGDGAVPMGGPIVDAQGDLIGTTYDGGNDANFDAGDGTVYKLTPDGTETILHVFGGPPDGRQPMGELVLAHNGALYGTTLQGGRNDQGTIFEITPDGRERVLYSFTGGTDGGLPYAGLTMDGAGTLYGTASQGGSSGAGVVFRITP